MPLHAEYLCLHACKLSCIVHNYSQNALNTIKEVRKAQQSDVNDDNILRIFGKPSLNNKA